MDENLHSLDKIFIISYILLHCQLNLCSYRYIKLLYLGILGGNCLTCLLYGLIVVYSDLLINELVISITLITSLIISLGLIDLTIHKVTETNNSNQLIFRNMFFFCVKLEFKLKFASHCEKSAYNRTDKNHTSKHSVDTALYQNTCKKIGQFTWSTIFTLTYICSYFSVFIYKLKDTFIFLTETRVLYIHCLLLLRGYTYIQ